MSSDGPSKVVPNSTHPAADTAARAEPLDDLILNDDEPIELRSPLSTKPSTPPPIQRARLPEHPTSPLPAPVAPPRRNSTRPEILPTDPDGELAAARAKAKMTLRIPDDEIARPILGSETPKGGIAVLPSRPPTPPIGVPIATTSSFDATTFDTDDASEPIVEDDESSPAITGESMALKLPAVGIDASNEPGWTPYQPEVAIADRTPAARAVAAGEGRGPRGTLLDRFEIQNDGHAAVSSDEIPIDMDLSNISSAPDTMEDPEVTHPRIPAALDSDEIRIDESDRVSEVGDDDELAADDLVSIDSLSPSQQTPAKAVTPVRASVHTPSQPPLAPPGGGAKRQGGLVFPPVGALAPPPMTDNAASRKKTRPWWEELFNDDFIRTMAKVTDAQILKEVNFIEESLGCEAGAMVLDLACGTGRHAVELAVRGYQVVGFDLSLAMLARASDEAQDRKQKLNFVQGDMREMTFEETFDGVYSWNTSFGYFDEEKNGAVIARVHKALKKGGQFLLDVVNRDYIVKQAPSLAWFEGDGCICMDEMTIDFITSRMKVKRTLMMDDGRTKEIEYSIRTYSLHELGKMLHDNGFRVAEVSGRTGTPGVFFGCESPRTLILAEKR
jgi:SAM-dependent methyltransferase